MFFTRAYFRYFIPPSSISSPPQEEKNLVEKTTLARNKIEIKIVVLGQAYPLSVPAKTTLYEAMVILSKDQSIEQSFSFTTKNFPGLGQFVESINGAPNESRKYWMYYINGKQGSIGVSNYIVEAGDIVEWKREKSF